MDSLELRVELVDFFLGLPVSAKNRPSAEVPLWTTFEDVRNASEDACAARCRGSLNCLAAFLGRDGCFQALNNHMDHEEAERKSRVMLAPRAAGNRALSGELRGCQGPSAGYEGFCALAQVEGQQGQQLHFRDVRPDWHGLSAQLTLAVVLEACSF